MKPYYFFLFALLLSFSLHGQNDCKRIPANHPDIIYMGRVQIENDTARFNWPGVAVSARFTGSQLGIGIKGGSRDYFNIYIDNRHVMVLHSPNDTVWFYPEKLSKGEHTMRLVKRTEGDMGMAVFSGLYIGKNELLLMPIPPLARKILFVGNSITCGYGTEGKDKTERFKPETENCEKSFATILARSFDAQYQLIAHSGLGMVRNYGDKDSLSVKQKPMPARLQYIFDNDSTQLVDMAEYIPDAVVINLGTNDFSTRPFPDEKSFISAGERLISKIKHHYPKTKIFCLTGPMINEPSYTYTKKIVESMRTKMNTSDVVFVGVPKDLLNADADLGSDWHPSYQGQIKMARLILPVMSTVLNWDYPLCDIK